MQVNLLFDVYREKNKTVEKVHTLLAFYDGSMRRKCFFYHMFYLFRETCGLY